MLSRLTERVGTTNQEERQEMSNPSELTTIMPLDRNNHNPFMDICYLECVVMDNGEVISGNLGSLGFIGEGEGHIELKHLYTVEHD